MIHAGKLQSYGLLPVNHALLFLIVIFYVVSLWIFSLRNRMDEVISLVEYCIEIKKGKDHAFSSHNDSGGRSAALN